MDAPNDFTFGDWTEENVALTELDRRIAASQCFKIFPEVWGYYTQPRYGMELEKPRIDRLLIPTEKLLRAGWRLGIIGIEGKASGLKLGPIICQCLDYSRATFELPNQYRVVPSWIFIWPLGGVQGDTESIMANMGLGACMGDGYSLLRLKCGSVNILNVTADGNIETCRMPNCGIKAGSR